MQNLQRDSVTDLRVLVIIPAYNEQDCIVDTVEAVIEAGYDHLVVNDGSKDATLELCRQHGFNVLDLKENLGIGGAVQAGHKYAHSHGYEIDVQFDGDGQHNVECIPDLVDAVREGFDLVIGSRFLDAQVGGFKSTAMRRAGITWLSGLIRAMTKTRATDPTSGFRACGKRAIALFCAEYPVDYPEPESIVEAVQQGLSIKDVPVVMNERQGGTSSIRPLSSVYYMVKVTLAIVIMALSKRGGPQKEASA